MIAAGQRLGPYEIGEPLGMGGMGEVYLARDPRLGRDLALKVLPARTTGDPSAVERFVREARAASALNHPNVVTIYEIGESPEGRYIAMELVRGRTLRDLMNESRDTLQLAQVGSQIARALSVAHAAGIVHRDVKPENVMVRADGLVKVLDFGIARLVGGDVRVTGETAAPTQAGVAMGTLRYMSPEQACAEQVDSATDLFSLGIVLHELMTGRHPFAPADGPASDIALVGAIVSAPAITLSASNPAIPRELDTLILRMLEKEPARRPSAAEVEAALSELAAPSRESGATSAWRPARTDRHTVGRERERAELAGALDEAARGRGVIVTIAGEPGIGKSTLAEDFLSDAAGAPQRPLIVRGRCSERLAGTEAYLPILEALDSLTRGASAANSIRLMKRLAPTWYLQIAPSSDHDSDARALTSVQASSQERMKRELAAFLQELSNGTPVVLFLDDLHWADVSTVDVLAYIGARLGSMRLMVLVTFRPAELLLNKHPFAQLKLDLQARGLCREIALEFLTKPDVEQYLRLEFPDHDFPPDFAALIHAKTEGSPLFMADLLRYLRTRGVLAQADGRWTLAQSVPSIENALPESIRGMIQRKIEQLGDADRKLLTAASVQGYEFDSAIAAQLTATDPADVEERLETLEHVFGFVVRMRELDLPDGTVSVRYRFVHVLYQNVLYASLTPSRRIGLSAQAAQALLEHYAGRSAEIAAPLAALFEVARDTRRAVDQLTIAAQNAANVYANQEAMALARRGLQLLEQLPASVSRDEQELALQVLCVNSQGAVYGLAAADVGQAASRAYDLWKSLGERPEHFPALGSLWTHYAVAAKLERCLEIGERLFQIAVDTNNRVALPIAGYCLGITQHHLGNHRAAVEAFDRGLAVHGPDLTPFYTSILIEPGVGSAAEKSRALWVLGYPDQALEQLDLTLRLAGDVPHPEAKGFAQLFGAFIYQFLGDVERTHHHGQAVLAIAAERDIATSLAWGMVLHGWAVAMQGDVAKGIAEIRASLAGQAAAGARIAWPQFYALLAEAYLKADLATEALTAITEGLACSAETSDHYWDSELERLRAESLDRTQANTADVDSCYDRALSCARRQEARSLELRAAMSAARIWARRGESDRARGTLIPIYEWFTEGFDTPDLRAARELIQSLT